MMGTRAVRAPRALAYQRRRREAVHGRHAQVHQDQIEALRGIACDRLGTVLDPYGRTSQRREITLRDGRVDRLVLHQQHVAADGRSLSAVSIAAASADGGATPIVAASASYRASRRSGLRTIASRADAALELLRLHFRVRGNDDQRRTLRATQLLVVPAAARIDDRRPRRRCGSRRGCRSAPRRDRAPGRTPAQWRASASPSAGRRVTIRTRLRAVAAVAAAVARRRSSAGARNGMSSRPAAGSRR